MSTPKLHTALHAFSDRSTCTGRGAPLKGSRWKDWRSAVTAQRFAGGERSPTVPKVYNHKLLWGNVVQAHCSFNYGRDRGEAKQFVPARLVIIGPILVRGQIGMEWGAERNTLLFCFCRNTHLPPLFAIVSAISF